MTKTNLNSLSEQKKNSKKTPSFTLPKSNGVSVKINGVNISKNYEIRQRNVYDQYSNDNYKKEIALWRAVILQAFVDLRSRSSRKLARGNRIRSRLWLRLSNRNFQLVCRFARLDPFYVWDRVQEEKKKIS